MNDIILRGMRKDDINVLVDGTKTYGACPNRMDPPISHVSPDNIENIKVIYGPYDVEDFGTLSGGVKVTTKQPKKGLHAKLNLGSGSYDTNKVGATAILWHSRQKTSHRHRTNTRINISRKKRMNARIL